jgi:hypothetical protein
VPVAAVKSYGIAACANPECRQEFERHAPKHLYCSDRCRWDHRDRVDPCAIANNRKRNAEWAAKNRGCKDGNPWLLGAPPFERYLPGAGLEIRFTPGITFEHQHISALHGVITSLTGAHDPNAPRFALVPWLRGCGWGVWLADEKQARALAGTTHRVRLGTGSPELHFGGVYRQMAPVITKRGHRKLRVDAITPVCVRHSTGEGNTYQIHTAPTAANMLSTLQFMTLKRIGLAIINDSLRLELVERHTEPSQLSLAGRGGKLKAMRGWIGNMVVDCNAPAHWLLEVAARIGLGGRTAFGFGRIRVTEV